MALLETEDVVKRGVEEIIIEKEFVEKLDSGKSLRLKMGFDPSAPDIHLGHAVGLRKLRQLQELGHKVVLIVGDWTAQIGDPSGRSQTRNMLSAEEVNANAQTYLDQFFKIVDRDRTEIRLQSEWFGPFSLANVIELTSKFTVAQILARDDFAKRFGPYPSYGTTAPDSSVYDKFNPGGIYPINTYEAQRKRIWLNEEIRIIT